MPASNHPHRGALRVVRDTAAALAVIALAACGGGTDDSESIDSTTVPAVAVPATVPAQAAGQGAVLLDGELMSFTVTECNEGSGEQDPVEATLVDSVEGSGTSGDDSFTVRISRYTSDTGVAVPLTTESVTVVFGEGDEARGVEARRSTSGPGGAWQDLRDPDATAPMIVRQGDSVEVEATFGPAQSVAGEPGLLEGHLRATCPA